MDIFTFFPKEILTNESLGKEYPEININRLQKKLGIVSRHIASKNETALDLAFQACSKISKATLKEVDFLIYCTQSPEYLLPTTACILQNKLGLSSNCGALDYNLGCSGYVYGLAMAKSLIKGNIASNVLLVTSETYSKHIHRSDWANRAIFGDAATATIVREEDVAQILEFDFGTNGSGAKNLILKGGGGVSGFKQDFSEANSLYMNGPEVFKFTLDSVPITVEQCLIKNKKTIDDIDFVIFHQANAYMLKNLRKKIGVVEDKFYINVKSVGNTVSNTIPIALKDSIDNGLIKSGDCVLLCGFGVGYSWGTTIITI